VQYATQAGSYQPRNVGDGEVIGAEIEFRQSFGLLSNALRKISISANFTYAKSRIKLGKTEYDSRVENARIGQTIDEYRDMAGQAPYIINSGIAYNGGDAGFWKGFEAGLYYNVQGQTLLYVGIADRPDIYSKSFHSLNFNSNKSFGRLQVGLKVDNLLNQKNEEVFKSFKATDRYFTRLNKGLSFSFSVGYKFF